MDTVKGGTNADDKWSGARIVASVNSEQSPRWVGAKDGLDGSRMKRLVPDGWRDAKFEISFDAPKRPNSNWFSFEDFMKKVKG
jgi:hypothetical protein